MSNDEGAGDRRRHVAFYVNPLSNVAHARFDCPALLRAIVVDAYDGPELWIAPLAGVEYDAARPCRRCYAAAAAAGHVMIALERRRPSASDAALAALENGEGRPEKAAPDVADRERTP
jgi:hypothetical protein